MLSKNVIPWERIMHINYSILPFYHYTLRNFSGTAVLLRSVSVAAVMFGVAG